MKEIKHTPNGTYTLDELLPPEVRDLTIEQVLALIVYNIASYTDDASITVTGSERTCIVELDLNPTDCGPIIGSHGAAIVSLRTLAKAMLGPKAKEMRYQVELIKGSVPSRFTNS